MSKKKIVDLEAFKVWVAEYFGREYTALNWGFAGGKYTTRYGGEPNEDNVWLWREFLRSYVNPATGKPHYAPVVWVGQLDPIENHFAHVSLSDQSQIAFTPNAEKGKRDVCINMKPGKYLAKYYPALSEDEVRRLANLHRDKYTNEDVAFAVTADEVEFVYLNGPSSCMAKTAEVLGCSQAPVRIYGLSESLVVAYLNRDSGISGRAVCDIGRNPPVFSRVYGDENLASKLLRMGFVKGGMGCFDGVRLPIVMDSVNAALMPYVDWHNYAYRDGDSLIIGSPPEGSAASKVAIQSTSGRIQIPVVCERCGADTTSEYLRSYTLHPSGEVVSGCDDCLGVDTSDRVAGDASSRDLTDIVRAFVDSTGTRGYCRLGDTLRVHDGTLVLKGVDPAAVGYREFDGEWYLAYDFIATVNAGEMPRYHALSVPFTDTFGDYVFVAAAPLGDVRADDLWIRRDVAMLSAARRLYKPSAEAVASARAYFSIGDVIRQYLGSADANERDVDAFMLHVSCAVTNALTQRLVRALWERFVDDAGDDLDFLCTMYSPANTVYSEALRSAFVTRHVSESVVAAPVHTIHSSTSTTLGASYFYAYAA